jgi:hypothetical protein
LSLENELRALKTCQKPTIQYDHLWESDARASLRKQKEMHAFGEYELILLIDCTTLIARSK